MPLSVFRKTCGEGMHVGLLVVMGGQRAGRGTGEGGACSRPGEAGVWRPSQGSGGRMSPWAWGGTLQLPAPTQLPLCINFPRI